MRITFPSIPVILVHTTMALHTAHRPTDHTNRRVQRSGITLQTHQRLLLVDEQVVQYERQLRRAINRGEVEDNSAVHLGDIPPLAVVSTPARERVLEGVLVWQVRVGGDTECCQEGLVFVHPL